MVKQQFAMVLHELGGWDGWKPVPMGNNTKLGDVMRQSQARLVVMYALPAHDGDLVMDHQISICGVVAGC